MALRAIKVSVALGPLITCHVALVGHVDHAVCFGLSSTLTETASDSMRAHVRRVQFAASNKVDTVDGPAQLGRKPAQPTPAISAQDGAVFARTLAMPICLRRLVTKSTSVWDRPGHPRGQPLDFRPPARICTGQARL